MNRGVVAPGNPPQRVAGPDDVCRSAIHSDPCRRDTAHVSEIRARIDGDVKVWWAVLLGRFDHPRTLEREERAPEPRAAFAVNRPSHVDRDARRVNRPAGCIPWLLCGRPHGTGEDQPLAACLPILGREALDESARRCRRIRESNTMERVVSVAGKSHQAFAFDSPAYSGTGLVKVEALPHGVPVHPLDAGTRTPKRLRADRRGWNDDARKKQRRQDMAFGSHRVERFGSASAEGILSWIGLSQRSTNVTSPRFRHAATLPAASPFLVAPQRCYDPEAVTSSYAQVSASRGFGWPNRP